MLLSPVVEVRGEKGRMGVEFDHRVKLIFPQSLGMDCDEPILAFSFLGGPDKFDRIQKLINSLISIAVSNDIVVVLLHFKEKGGQDGIIRKVVFPARFIVAGPAFIIGVVV